MALVWRTKSSERQASSNLLREGLWNHPVSNKLDKTSRIIYDGDIMTNMKEKLKKINDELMELYNKPSMALHFQPTNLRVLRRLITKLVLLEKEDEKN